MISSTQHESHKQKTPESVYFRLSKERFAEEVKMVALPIVLFIFISSNYPNGTLDGQPILVTPTADSDKRCVENKKASREHHIQVNDLTADAIHYPDDVSRLKGFEVKKIVQEKPVQEVKNVKNKEPVPLYSLVKNVCGEGYALDQNGVCQKAITARNDKNFDSERKRRRRFAPDFYETKQRNLMSLISEPSMKTGKTLFGNGFGKITTDCGSLYPGLVPDGAGGCTKPVKVLYEPFPQV